MAFKWRLCRDNGVQPFLESTKDECVAVEAIYSPGRAVGLTVLVLLHKAIKGRHNVADGFLPSCKNRPYAVFSVGKFKRV